MNTLSTFETDVFHTSIGDLKVSFLGHGSLLFTLEHQNIYIDVFGKVADYTLLPKADLILITHEHFDHFDPVALQAIRRENTVLIYTRACEKLIKGGIVLNNGERTSYSNIQIEATRAYNIMNIREDGKPFHPLGDGNGYLLDFGDTRVFVAGDTENIPEMKTIVDVDIAFLPMNLPYTMTPEMVADAAKTFRPRILYPYHFGTTNTNELLDLLKNEPGIEVRLRHLN